MDRKTIGTRLKEYRGSMRPEELAMKLGVSVTSIFLYESGKRVPRDPVKKKYAELFGTTVGKLFFGE